MKISNIFKRLSFRLTVLVLFIAIIPTGIGLAAFFYVLKNDFKNATINGLVSELDDKANGAVNLLEIVKGEVKALASNFEGDSPLYEEVVSECESIIRTNKNYLKLEVIGDTGQELVCFVRTAEAGIQQIPFDKLQNESQMKSFQKILKSADNRVHVMPISLRKEQGKIALPHVPILQIGKKIVMKGNHLFGIVILSVDADMVFGSLIAEEQSRFLITNEQGDYLHHWNKNILFGNELGHDVNLFDEELEIVDNLKKQDSSINYDPESNKYRVWRKVFFDDDKSKYWVFMKRRTQDSIISPWLSIEKKAYIGFGAVMVLSFIIITILIHKTLFPLNKLVNSIRLHGKDILSLRIDIESKTEIGDIVSSLNLASKKLKKMDLELRRKMALERSISDTAPNAHIIVSKSGEFISINSAAEVIFGYKSEELVGQKVDILMPSPHKEHCDEYIQKYLNSDIGKVIENAREQVAVKKDGEEFPVNLYISEAGPEDDKVFVAIVQDMTEHKRNEQLLVERDERFRDITSTLGEGVCIVDEGLNITFINPEAEQLLGWKADELIGKDPHQTFLNKRFDGDTYPIEECAILEAVKSGNDYRGKEDAFTTKDGRIFPVLVTATTIKSNGCAKGGILAFQDITVLKKSARDIQQKTNLIELMKEVVLTTNEAITVDEAMKVCIDKICSHTGWPIGHAYLPDSTGTLSPSNIRNDITLEKYQVFLNKIEDITFAPGVGLPGKVMQEQKPFCVVDVADGQDFLDPKLVEDADIKGFFAFPVLEEGKVTAVLEFYSNKVEELDESLMGVIILLTSLLGRVTWRKRAEDDMRDSEQKLKESEQKLGLHIQQTPLAVIECNTDLEITEWNLEAERIFGHSKDEIVGKQAAGIIVQEESAKIQLNLVLGDLINGKDGSSDTYESIKKDGSAIFCEWHSAPLVDKNGNIIGATSLVQDVTERKLAEEEARKAGEMAEEAANKEKAKFLESMNLEIKSSREMAKAAEKAKDEFIGSFNREIRTPMNAIIGMAEFLNDADLSDEQKKYMDVFKNAGKDMLNFVNESKTEIRHLELIHTNFDLHKLVEKTCTTLAGRAKKKEIGFTYCLEEDMPGALIGDPDGLQQILINLIGNAIKFTETGKVEIHAEESLHFDQSSELQFSIIDTGTGILEEKKKAIFDGLVPADLSATNKNDDTGLGLPASKQLVEKMGGHIWVENNEDGGSIFHFTAKFERQDIPVEIVKPEEPETKIRSLNIQTAVKKIEKRPILKLGIKICEIKFMQYCIKPVGQTHLYKSYIKRLINMDPYIEKLESEMDQYLNTKPTEDQPLRMRTAEDHPINKKITKLHN